MGWSRGAVQIENDENSMKTETILPRFGRTFGILRFKEESFINTLLGFLPFCECKPTNALHIDSSGIFFKEKVIILSTLDEVH